MDQIWYYAEGDKSLGPLTLADMTAILSRVSNARNVLVWRDGFSSWVEAGNVPELSRHVIKPPPLPGSTKPPPIPVPRLRQTVIPAPTSTSTSAPTSPPDIREVPTQHERHEKNRNELAGIGGWLILVAFGQIVGPLRLLVSIFNYYKDLESDVWAKYPVTFYGEAVLYMSLLVLSCYTAYLFFQKSRLFPKFLIYELVAQYFFIHLT